ncbi:hypothetical protein RYX36_017965, partial [Vicia faba]
MRLQRKTQIKKVEFKFISHFDQVILVFHLNKIIVIKRKLELALYLLQSSNNVLLNTVLAKATTYWDDQERKRKAFMKDI